MRDCGLTTGRIYVCGDHLQALHGEGAASRRSGGFHRSSAVSLTQPCPDPRHGRGHRGRAPATTMTSGVCLVPMGTGWIGQTSTCCSERNARSGTFQFTGSNDFSDERVLVKVEETWEQWLGPLASDLPAFKTVIGAVHPRVAKLVPAISTYSVVWARVADGRPQSRWSGWSNVVQPWFGLRWKVKRHRQLLTKPFRGARSRPKVKVTKKNRRHG